MSLGKVTVCLYEDRPRNIAGVKLLLLSLNRHAPELPIRLWIPRADSSFQRWAEAIPTLTLLTETLPGGGSYNVKPAVLIDAIDAGWDTCIWLDTDIIINGPLDLLLSQPPEVLMVSEDPWIYDNGASWRAERWGLPVGRSMPGPVNTAVIRVTKSHRGLMVAWQEIMERQDYLEQQKITVKDRDHQMLSDQDAFSALLASSRFSDVTVAFLKHGKDVLQHHGAGAYSLSDRLCHLREGLPPIIHAMGSVKPWLMPNLRRSLKDLYELAYLEQSPYVYLARGYSDLLEEDTSWMSRKTLYARLESALFFNRPALNGCVLSVVHSNMRSLRKKLA